MKAKERNFCFPDSSLPVSSFIFRVFVARIRRSLNAEKYAEKFARKYRQRCPQLCARLYEHVCLHLCL